MLVNRTQFGSKLDLKRLKWSKIVLNNTPEGGKSILDRLQFTIGIKALSQKLILILMLMCCGIYTFEMSFLCLFFSESFTHKSHHFTRRRFSFRLSLFFLRNVFKMAKKDIIYRNSLPSYPSNSGFWNVDEIQNPKNLGHRVWTETDKSLSL